MLHKMIIMESYESYPSPDFNSGPVSQGGEGGEGADRGGADSGAGMYGSRSYSNSDSNSDSLGYTAQSSKALEANLAAARALVDPLTKSIPWEHLPREERVYTFGPEFLQFLSDPVRLRLLIESRMAWGGAGHCRKLTSSVTNHLDSLYSYGISLWQTSDDYHDLLKSRSGSTPTNSDKGQGQSWGGEEGGGPIVLGQDAVLDQWFSHYRKYLDKQAKKMGRVGVNLANIPYTAGPIDIKRAVEQLLGWEGSVSAIDPWWQKEAWNHDGTVTVYMPKVAANDLVARCEQQELMIRPPRGAGGPRIIKAWLAKGVRAGISPQSSEHSEDSSSESHVSQSLDNWA